MILLLDVGNTNIYAGISDGQTLLQTFRMQTIETRTPDEYFVSLKPFTSDYQIKQIVISSVVPKVTLELKKLAIKFFDLTPLVVSHGVKTGIFVKADNPREVGADLICVAAGLESTEPTLIIDLGTATKYIYVKNKTIIGVIIAPGIEVSMKTLTASTALLPEVDLVIPPRVLGTNSVHCIQSGILYGNACAIEGLVAKIKGEVKEDFRVVLTGGLSSVIEPILTIAVTRDPRLVLTGMINIYQKNKGV